MPRASKPWVDRQAEPGVATLAVEAKTAADVERHVHAVALLHPDARVADLLDDPLVLVAEHDARLSLCPSLIHVQVRAADTCRGDPHDRVRGSLDPRIID